MNQRPRSITVLSWVFIVFGAIALLAGLLPRVNISAAQRVAEFKTHWYVHLSRIAMILSGVFMLYGFNWARWLMVVWIVFHIVISALHSIFQLSMHVVIFAVILYFLFRAPASAYFHQRRDVRLPLKPAEPGDSVKPGVERSGTPGSEEYQVASPRSGRQPIQHH